MEKTNVPYKIFQGDCLQVLDGLSDETISLTFVDPPFNQGKDYKFFNDSQPDSEYWSWLKNIFAKIYAISQDGGAIYFMHREKNTESMLRVLRETGWEFQNLIIWKKKTSAVPSSLRYSKQYQVIVFATKGKRPRVFHRLRADLPVPRDYKYGRDNGIYLSDIWDDIRELTSGYFAGDEALRDKQGSRIHIQQSPVALLLRIILSSSLPGDTILDPFAGSGTTLVVADQLHRNSIGIEIDPYYVKIINKRLDLLRPADDISHFHKYYRFTESLEKIWLNKKTMAIHQGSFFDGR